MRVSISRFSSPPRYAPATLMSLKNLKYLVLGTWGPRHKSSKSPRQFLLFVSLHPKLSKFILGVKSFNKEDREKIVSVYDNLPLDQKGRLHDALKYVSITNEIKFESVDADVLRLVENTLAFYAENFKDSLNWFFLYLSYLTNIGEIDD